MKTAATFVRVMHPYYSVLQNRQKSTFTSSTPRTTGPTSRPLCSRTRQPGLRRRLTPERQLCVSQAVCTWDRKGLDLNPRKPSTSLPCVPIVLRGLESKPDYLARGMHRLEVRARRTKAVTLSKRPGSAKLQTTWTLRSTKALQFASLYFSFL